MLLACWSSKGGAGTTVVASVASLDEVARMQWAGLPQQITLATGPHAVPAA